MVGGLLGSPTDGWAWMLAFHDWRAAEGSGRICGVPSGLFADLLGKKNTIVLFIFSDCT